MVRELRKALGGDDIVPHFQPMIDLRTGRLIGFEVLARWLHPRSGMLPPAQFIPVAEKAGLIEPLTEHLLRNAARVAAGWPAHLLLSVNLSPLLLVERSFPMRLRATSEQSGFPPNRLVCEITEGSPLDNLELACVIASNMRASGIRLSLDDFGTGYSNLQYLQVLPLDQVKIDLNFVRLMLADPKSEKIVNFIIRLAHGLGLTVVAEGIEYEAQAAMLTSLGCDVGQGWLLGRPLSAEKTTARLPGLRRHKVPARPNAAIEAERLPGM
jgi:EAL domain-containing protein (putative c-di-GMP-specific phosphodiesterase class I)